MSLRRNGLLAIVISVASGFLWAQFSLMNMNFPGVFGPGVEFADYDSDGDMDFILTGSTHESGYGIANLYTNDGSGQFTLTPTPFTGVFRGNVDWGDYNNDGHPDIVITGWTTSTQPVTNLYRNLGNGSFQLVDAGFVGVYYSSVEWADYNLDGWLDLLVAGANDAGIQQDIPQQSQRYFYRYRGQSLPCQLWCGHLG